MPKIPFISPDLEKFVNDWRIFFGESRKIRLGKYVKQIMNFNFIQEL